jgi:hypothetical protein
MTKKFEIRNSTAEFLIFQIEGKEDGVQVLYRDETIWCTQDVIAILFDKAKSTISEHLKKYFFQWGIAARKGSLENPNYHSAWRNGGQNAKPRGGILQP